MIPRHAAAPISTLVVDTPATRGPRTWRYAEPNLNGLEGWWVAFVDDAGCLSVQSDFGDYSYRWNMCGMPERDGQRIGLREFLLDVGSDYVLNKFAGRTEFDDVGTLKAVKLRIIEQRKDASLDADGAREEWDLATRLLSNASGGDAWVSHTTLEEPWNELGNRFPREATAFMERIWPRIVAKIRADLSGGAA